MKRHIVNFLTLILPLAMCACSDDNKEPDTPTNSDVKITVVPEVLNVDFEGATMELSVTSTADWSIRSEASWCTPTPTGGSKNQTTTIKVKIDATKEAEARTTNLVVTSSGAKFTVPVNQTPSPTLNISTESLSFGGQATETTLTLTTNLEWKAESDASWCKVSPESGDATVTTLKVSVEANKEKSSREAKIRIKAGDLIKEVKVSQYTDEIIIPEGYTLVWHDEFNEGTVPGPDWVLENQPAGWVNHELQTYTSRVIDGKRTVEIKDGFLNITCFKAADGKIYSGRMNAKPSTGWLYGYFEARINLPKGKGTWPAYWMMPCNVDWGSNPWPKCGEIDIMEEVGADPNQVSSSIHTQNYNHTINTQKTHAMNCPGAEGEFHIYALEWTEDRITTYVDGKVQLQVTKAQLGADHDSWPFHYAFYPILNLAWGGDWGGYTGVDDSALPCTMKVDYVRIFQKK